MTSRVNDPLQGPKRTRLRVWSWLAVVVVMAACSTFEPSRRFALEQAAFNHRCPVERIRVIRESPDLKTKDLDVCGEVVRYQLIGNAWVDVTKGSR